MQVYSKKVEFGDVWYREKDKQKAADALVQLVEDCKLAVSGRDELDRVACSLYYGRSVVNGSKWWSMDPNNEMAGTGPKISFNLMKSQIRTSVPRICKSTPRAMFLTDNGNWGDRIRAIKVDRAVAGAMKNMNYHEKAKAAVRDGRMFGTGCLYFYKYKGQPWCDRVLRSDIVVDEKDAEMGDPTWLARVVLIDRGRLIELYPEHAKAIKEAQPSTEQFPVTDGPEAVLSTNATGGSDMVRVIHAWRLPSGEESGDGVELVVMTDGSTKTEGSRGGNFVLFKGEWTHDIFPFVFYHDEVPISGFWGDGITDELVGRQGEMDVLMKQIRTAFRGALPRWWLPEASGVTPEQMTDDNNICLTYTGGNPPSRATPQAIDEQYLNYLRMLKDEGFEQSGVSQYAATSQKPAGVSSGIALQRYEGVEDQRFLFQSQRWEQMAVDAARQILRLCKDLAEEDEDYKLRSWDASRKITQQVMWKDIELKPGTYTLDCYPVSSLPSDVTGRTELVSYWAAKKLIDHEEERMLLDFPDTTFQNSLRNAEFDLIMLQIEQMLFDGVPADPDPNQNKQVALKWAKWYYLRALTDGCPEENLGLLRNYMVKIEALLSNMTKQNNNGMQPGFSPPGMPMGPPPGPPPGMPIPGPIPGPMPGPMPEPGMM